MHPATRRACVRVLIGVSAATGLAACSGLPVALDDERASMHVPAQAMTATTIGESLVIAATVMDAHGQPLRGPAIHWEVSSPGVLDAVGDGRFRVVQEGEVRVTAVWPRDPSVRATVLVRVDAGLVAMACIARFDQAVSGAPRKCAQRRVVVSTAQVAPVVSAAALGRGIEPRGAE